MTDTNPDPAETFALELIQDYGIDHSWRRALTQDIRAHDSALVAQYQKRIADLAASLNKAWAEVEDRGRKMYEQRERAEAADTRCKALEASMVSHFQREHLEGDGPEIDRWRTKVKELESELAQERACHDCREYRETLEGKLAEAKARTAELEHRMQLTTGHLLCGGCGGPHPFDTSVPSAVWNAVIRRKGLSEYLCLTCIVREFANDGESFTAQLWGDDGRFGHFDGLPIEVRVNGEVAKDAAKVSEENTQLRVESAERARQVEALREELDALRRLDDGKSPCGHFAAHATTSDGGKTITCLDCRVEALTKRLEAAEKCIRLVALTGVLSDSHKASQRAVDLALAYERDAAQAEQPGEE